MHGGMEGSMDVEEVDVKDSPSSDQRKNCRKAPSGVKQKLMCTVAWKPRKAREL